MHSTATISNIVCWTRETCYRESGSYKGVYVKNTQFQKDLTPFQSLKSDNSNIVPNLMIKIVNQKNRDNPALKDSIPVNVIERTNEITEFDHEHYINDITDDEMDNMGVSSQVECYLSQHKEKNYNNVENKVT